MIVNKNGKVVANVSQPTLVFETQAAYDTWYATLPGTDPKTTELNKFVIVKKYEVVEEAGMVIFKDDVATMKASTTKIDGALYVAKAENEIYRYYSDTSKTPAEDVWVKLGGGVGGGVILIANHAALPAAASAIEDTIYVELDTNTSYIVKPDKSGYHCFNTNVDVVTTAFDPTTAAAREKGSLVVDTVNNKTYVALGLSASPAYMVLCEKNTQHATEFAANVASFAGIDASKHLNAGYAVEDRFFVAKDTWRMYVIEEISPATSPATYEYVEVSTCVDNVDCFATKADFPAVGTADVLYVAKDEGVIYIWDTALSTPAYSAVGGNDEVQTYATKADLPSSGKPDKLYAVASESELYIWVVDTTKTEGGYYTAVGGQTEVNVYDSYSAFPTEGVEGRLYVDKSNGKQYVWDVPVGGTTKAYLPVGGDNEVEIYNSKVETAPGAGDGFPATGMLDRIYIAKDTKAQYIWNSGTSAYDELTAATTTYATQAEWEAAVAAGTAPDISVIQNGIYDFDAYY